VETRNIERFNSRLKTALFSVIEGRVTVDLAVVRLLTGQLELSPIVWSPCQEGGGCLCPHGQAGRMFASDSRCRG